MKVLVQPTGEGFVACDGDGVFLFAFGKDLEEEFGAAAVQFHIAKLETHGAELLFQITAREERASIACASNAPFSEWGQTFTDPRLCAAIVDRLTFRVHIINTGTDSYRLKTTQQTINNKSRQI